MKWGTIFGAAASGAFLTLEMLAEIQLQPSSYAGTGLWAVLGITATSLESRRETSS